jgi:hypothetical protein
VQLRIGHWNDLFNETEVGDSGSISLWYWSLGEDGRDASGVEGAENIKALTKKLSRSSKVDGCKSSLGGVLGYVPGILELNSEYPIYELNGDARPLSGVVGPEPPLEGGCIRESKCGVT